MVHIRLIPLLLILALFSMSSAWAAAANSPEALAMAMADAHRRGDASAIVALHYFVPMPNSSVAQQQAAARREWRALIQQYKISGYRLSMLSAEDRRQFQTPDFSSLAPVKKLLITLVERHGAEKQIANHYIIRVAGRYFFFSLKKQIKQYN